MAPIPRNTAAIAEGEDGKLYVMLNDDCRPSLEKLKSCDFSVEESSESLELSEPQIWDPKSRGLGYATTFVKGRLDFNQVNLPTLEKEKEELKFSYELKHTEYKLHKPVKLRSPTENDELPSNAAITASKLVDEAPSCIEPSLSCEDERQEFEHIEIKKKKKSKTPAVSHSTPQKKKNSKSNEIFKRQSIGKVKRNTWVIISPENTQQPVKKLKLKRRNSKRKIKVEKQNGPIGRSYKKSDIFPAGNQCVDSGISDGSSCNGGQNGQQSEPGECTNGGGGGGGGGGFCRKKGLGGNGRDDDYDKRPLCSDDVNMEDEEEDEEEEDVKMPSKEGSDMDCHTGKPLQHSVPWEEFRLQTQHLQHSSYCGNIACQRPWCREMKGEVIHLKTHKLDSQCNRCQKIVNLLKLHAATCTLGACRVPSCKTLRENKSLGQQAVQVNHLDQQVVHVNFLGQQAVQVNHPGQHAVQVNYPGQQAVQINHPGQQAVQVNYQAPPQPVNVTPNYKIDGLVVFDNTDYQLKHKVFQERMDYQKGRQVGKGANGNVWEVQFPASSPFYKCLIVVKETNYTIKKDEISAYEVANHPNILKPFLVVMLGNEGKASIFMERCDKSLKDLCNERQFKRLDPKEALFYWRQVLDAVVHLHENGVIHKDIKGQNILLSEFPGSGEGFRAKLADYDSAKKLENEFTEGNMKPMGTKGFTSPEVMKRLPHGRPADIFSMGGLLMELVGIYPKQEELQQQVQELIGINEFLGKLVYCCVQQDQSKRPTALELQSFLNSSIPEELC